MSGRSMCFVFREPAAYAFADDADFGRKLFDAIRAFATKGEPQRVTSQRRYCDLETAAWLIGTSTPDAPQVYVVEGHNGAPVTKQKAQPAHLDALVNVLRAHGYTCIKRGVAKDEVAA